MSAVGVIPARLGSTRLPNKVLADIEGKPMIQHTWEQAQKVRQLDEVWVACDDSKIVDCVEGFGGKAVLTSKNHPNGTSRIAEAAEKIDADVFINIQGDQPVLDPKSIDDMIDCFNNDAQLNVATIVKKVVDSDAFLNPNVVKVVCDRDDFAIYFSRSAIPFSRDQEQSESFLKHIGIYGYKKSFLLDFVSWSEGRLESVEKLEQLRILENGEKIKVVFSSGEFKSVDTQSDLDQLKTMA